MHLPIGKTRLALKAFRQLGPKASLLYARYQIQLRSGMLKRRTPLGPYPAPSRLEPLNFDLPSRRELTTLLGEHIGMLQTQANEILAGQVRLFGAPPRPLVLTPPGPLRHWTAHNTSLIDGQDVKFVWEPGRFGWAATLARAYTLTGEEGYAESFWQLTEEFLQANPPNLGPHWASAQEAALRLIALTFCYHLLQESPHTTAERTDLLSSAIAAHAERIPPTIEYARAQGNNHLLTEAAGLYTAAALLPDHPHALRWRRLGWRWFNRGVRAQVTPGGTYTQHSINYHRLMLQTGLWMQLVARSQGDTLLQTTRARLAAAATWLLALVDRDSGQTPKLGANDGAYILPLTVCSFEDYRPVLQAAGRAFLGENPLPSGTWDEMAAWLAPHSQSPPASLPSPEVVRLEGEQSWAYLRAARFTGRPSHADQLHFDLWWRGLNIAQDPGTYLYNAAPPWENALAGTDVHNTITLENRHQMTRAGRFLWLDWAQAQILEQSADHVLAQQNGYQKLGCVHHRKVERRPGDIWEITDTVSSTTRQQASISTRLHWLLPDWPWELEETTLTLQSPQGQVVLAVTSAHPINVSLARAGEHLLGQDDVQPYRGWAAPTYSIKQPALSLALEIKAPPPIVIKSTFTFSAGS